jgi:hypothetical protein
MNTFKQGSFSGCEAHHREVPVIALANTASHEALDVVWRLRIGDTRTMEQRAIERWEHEQGKRTRFVKGRSLRPSTFHQFLKAIST